MNPSPYRTVDAPYEHDFDYRRSELLPFFAVLWLASVARVIAAALLGETFGPEPTMALIVVFLLPWLTRDELAVSSTCRRS